MNLFVNDTPVKLRKPEVILGEGSYNYIIDAQNEEITKARLIHHVWIKNVTVEHMRVILELLHSKVPTSLLSLEITTDYYDEVKQFVRKQFKLVRAAGGLIRKKDKLLMIYRLKKWDLPKGKREKGESNRETALREVVEECNINVKLGKKICTTWHTYTMNKKSMIKCTKWYMMGVIDDSKMQPCVEEDIEELRWMTQKEVYHALQNSYKSIQFVFEEYYKKTEDLKFDLN
ncbi:MAG: NUDIX domain-containing protein [Cyclobacteriaceae bacterium]|nr:NUDIX domain-containing protein [Cyclobacteriaceae bacterium]